MEKQCVRCGIHIQDGLRCSRCRERVDEELYGLISRPLSYYFRYYHNIAKKKVFNS